MSLHSHAMPRSVNGAAIATCSSVSRVDSRGPSRDGAFFASTIRSVVPAGHAVFGATST